MLIPSHPEKVDEGQDIVKPLAEAHPPDRDEIYLVEGL